ncbi:hypothetical protein E4N62_16440 [Streptomyces sp. MNU76]|uniref:hypothetical protein n=1 Tax=Streptomyces sp. MNU76 TaxID=2560026 RepID=UPI001E432679|nr:hypothetical protein [Streptomyces sp. MNU76]MCC9706719.1 hypothetical protein [Streptomyces sp. MNU76]
MCGMTRDRVVDRRIHYTTVGEAHAYWDAKATFEYENKLSSNVEVAVKAGGKWTIQGTVTLASAASSSTGYYNRGPYFAKQWRVPIEYKKHKQNFRCDGRVWTQYKIIAGRYKIPTNGPVGKFGKNVAHKDGGINFHKSPRSHRTWVPRGSGFSISTNRSSKISGAVSAFGVTLGASTRYDKDHKQRIIAGNKTLARHEIWGKNGPVDAKPGVFYSN